MIEIKIRKYLEDKLKVPVYMEHRDKEKGSYIIMEKLGGTMRDQIYRSSYAFQSYGDRMLDALKLNDRLVQAMLNYPDCGASKLDSNYNFTDTSTKKYRYQAVFDIVF